MEGKSVPPMSRRRWLYVVGIALVICAGLAARSKAVGLPPFVAKYAGDALWALMVFLGLGFLLPRRSTTTIMVLAPAVSVAVEFSHLYHAPWIYPIRRTSHGQPAQGD